MSPRVAVPEESESGWPHLVSWHSELRLTSQHNVKAPACIALAEDVLALLQGLQLDLIEDRPDDIARNLGLPEVE